MHHNSSMPNRLREVQISAGPMARFLDRISDTRSQGYTSLQSLVKCLDHRNIVSDTACSQAKAVLGTFGPPGSVPHFVLGFMGCSYTLTCCSDQLCYE